MKRRIYASLLCVILLVSACTGGQPDIYEQPEQDLESDDDSVLAEPLTPVALPVQEEPEPEEEYAEPELPQTYDANETPEPSLTPEEIRELLDSIPYVARDMSAAITAWRAPNTAWHDAISIANYFMTDETGEEIADFISWMFTWWRPLPTRSFTMPSEANSEFIFSASFSATHWVQWRSPESAPPAYHPELAAIQPYIEYPPDHPYLHGYQISRLDHVVLHGHMERSARMLFGQELEIIFPENSWLYNLYTVAGNYLYNSDAAGSPASFTPVILSYEYIGGGYKVSSAFVWYFNGQYYPPGSEWGEGEGMPKDALLDYLRTTTQIHTITLKRNADGGFYYWAHILPGD